MQTVPSKKKIFLFFVFIAGGLFFSCNKKDNGAIPNVPVDIYIYTGDPLFFSLQVAGGWEYVTGGSRGILIYHASNSDFMAYDRHCPYLPENTCGQIAVNSTNISAVDSCCGSQFSMVDGSIQKGPAAMPLKQYQATFDGTVLHIFN